MKKEEIEEKLRCGETSRVQFKRQFTTQKQIAEEMVAFANCEGGDILFGVDDKTGAVVGLDFDTIQQVSRELGNTANEHVRPTIYIRTDVAEIDGKMILVATILPGRNKPYKDLTGCIWVKQGADKRRVTENSEILALFQQSGEYHPDEAGIPGTSAEDIDSIALNRFFNNVYRKPLKDFGIPQERVLRNLHITDAEGRLTTAGLLFFGQEPQRFKPLFVIKAVWFYGNSIAGTEYRDSRDIEGTIPEMYDQAMRWVQSCLRRPQCGQSFNSIGKLEIPEPVLEELLQKRTRTHRPTQASSHPTFGVRQPCGNHQPWMHSRRTHPRRGDVGQLLCPQSAHGKFLRQDDALPRLRLWHSTHSERELPY